MSTVIIGRMGPTTAVKTDSRLAARLAALASLGASIIHFAVVPNHWQEWMPAGVFFVALALVQLIWAWVVLARTTPPVLAVGIMLNVGAIALWALSRTAGAPFGPHAGQAEVVQAADLCALLLQIYVVMGAGWVWYRGLQGEPVPVFASAVVLLGAVGVVSLASTVGVASGLQHGHHAPAGAADSHHGSSADEADADHHGTRGAPAEGDPPGTNVEHADGHSDGHAEPVTPPPAPSATPLDDGHADHDHGE